MPADENSADSGADHTPDETPENGSGPEDTGSDRAGATRPNDRDDPGGTVPGSPENGDENGDGDGSRDAEPPEDSGDGNEDEGEDGKAAASVPPVRGKRRRVRRILMWTAVGLVLVLAAGAATAYGYYHSLRSGMVQHDIDSALQEEDRPERINDAVNVLFMGTDGYEEGSTAYTQEFEGERSDAIMLAHISPEKRVSVISFPRDSLVDLPQCAPYGETEGTQAYFGMINAAMYHGGPPCVVRTIESLTGIRIDHFVHLSFMSFRDVVNAIGGVDICIPEPMQDSRSDLDLEAGQQILNGDEALSFVRARYEIGNGSDIGRIDRQQMFLAALADQVTSNDVLSSPAKLNGILQAVARNSATDQALTLDRMLSLAVTLSGVDLTDIDFHTVPWYQAPFDPNRVMWYEEEAAALFTAVREDRPVSALTADDAAAPQDPPGTSPSPVDISSANASPPDVPESARPGQGRDATSDPCADGLGFGTGEETE
ncbi:LCP family protein [Nocardiopsis quinghaiensis]|uniref:LCP family protein n=1 Tax=Nocardiopsis quinghaiensis TaxID=464995 RepID=UPI001239C412|nr:LCP family protein [Nocardiopsis quinghaiensis]